MKSKTVIKGPGLAIFWSLTGALYAQALVVDRGLPAVFAAAPEQRVGWTEDHQSFLGDDFQIGNSGETWVIDTIRTWAVKPAELADGFERITLYGGIAADPPAPGQTECACHGPVALKTVTLQRGRPAPQSPDVRFTAVDRAPDLWQIDFRNLRWSVPGGVAIEYGVKAAAREAFWLYGASPAKEAHRLRVFNESGMLLSFLNAPDRISLQVWAHRMARVSVKRSGEQYQVTLHGEPHFDVNRVDRASLRFGAKGIAVGAGSLRDSDLVVTVRATDIAPGTVSGCLAGQLDGVPFEGCDLVKQR
jgi:hypothetical protein